MGAVLLLDDVDDIVTSMMGEVFFFFLFSRVVLDDRSSEIRIVSITRIKRGRERERKRP